MKRVFLIVFFLILTLAPTSLKSQEYLYITPEFAIVKIDDDTVKFKGNFTEGSGISLIMAITTYPFKNLIIESNGGLMMEAIMLGKLLQSTDMTIIVEKDTLCVSACAFAIMGADDIKLDGSLVFHAPYYPTIPTNEPLYDVFRNTSLLTLELTEWFLQNGYSLSFLELMYENTNNEVFMVFNSIEDFESFKTENALELPENYTEKYLLLEDSVIFK